MQADVFAKATIVILKVEKENDPIIQRLKHEYPSLYEALRKADRIDVPLQEVHGFGVSGGVFVEDDAFPPMNCKNNLQLDLIIHAFGTPPTGADFKADIRKRHPGSVSPSILKDLLVFPAGFTGVIERAEFGIPAFKRDEVLICDMKQVGSSFAGDNMTIFMFFTVLPDPD